MKAFLILGDAAVTALAVGVHPLLWSDPFPQPGLLWLALAGSLIVGVYVVEGYDVRAYREPNGLVTRLLIGVGLSTLGMSVLTVAYPHLGLYRRPVVLLAADMLGMLFLWRLAAARWLRRSLAPRRVAVVGGGRGLMELRAAFEESAVYEIALCVQTDGEPTIESGSRITALGEASLAELVHDEEIDLVAVADGAVKIERLLHQLVDCRYREVEVQDAPSTLEMLQQRVPIRFLDDQWVAFSSRFMGWDRDFEEKLKRLIDVAAALVGLIVTLPLFAIIALAVALTSRGGVFFRQERVGRGGSTFTLVKFRSMGADAEVAGAVWAQPDDPRTTPIGGLLRTTHLDELPQLWNVLRGNMSLVGPRPERPEFVAELRKAIPYYDLRHVVKPGLTGWAQIRHPYGASVEDAESKLEYDLYYLRHKNLLWDLRILLRTVTVAITRRGSR